jgi:hypothetical protein
MAFFADIYLEFNKESGMNWKRKSYLLFAASLLILTAQVHGTTMLQLDLGELTARADKIFRGTVIDVEQSTVQAGGGELPAVTYRFRVDELFKGEATQVKGEEAMIEIRMVGSIKDAETQGDNVRLNAFRDVPKLTMGGDYLLFSTPESAIGLSVTVGLGQGAFKVFSQNKEDFAVNEFDNMGLGLDSSGAVKYTDLAAAIQGLLTQ